MGAPRTHQDREWLSYLLRYLNTSRICLYLRYKHVQNLSRMLVPDETVQIVIDFLEYMGISRGECTASDEQIVRFMKLDFVFHNKFSTSDPDFFRKQFKMGLVSGVDIDYARKLLKQLNVSLYERIQNEGSTNQSNFNNAFVGPNAG